MTHGGPANAPTTGGSTLTLLGTNFGAASFSPSAWIGATQCSPTDWTSTTSITCKVPAGGGVALTTTVSVALLTSTARSWLTYDGACDAGAVSVLVLGWIVMGCVAVRGWCDRGHAADRIVQPLW